MVFLKRKKKSVAGACCGRKLPRVYRYTRGSLLPQHAPAIRSRSKAPSSAPTISSRKNMLRKKTFAPEFCSLISNWFDMREQAPGANLLHDSVSGVSSLVCTEICFAGACFRSKLPRVYWLGYLPGCVFRERVSGASSFVCTGWSTYPGACFGSVVQEQAPSCVPALKGLKGIAKRKPPQRAVRRETLGTRLTENISTCFMATSTARRKRKRLTACDSQVQSEVWIS